MAMPSNDGRITTYGVSMHSTIPHLLFGVDVNKRQAIPLQA